MHKNLPKLCMELAKIFFTVIKNTRMNIKKYVELLSIFEMREQSTRILYQHYNDKFANSYL